MHFPFCPVRPTRAPGRNELSGARADEWAELWLRLGALPAGSGSAAVARDGLLPWFEAKDPDAVFVKLANSVEPFDAVPPSRPRTHGRGLERHRAIDAEEGSDYSL